MPKVSVIVPVYNAEKYLERCVESLVNQTFADLEVILVDDGSKDASPQICDRLAAADARVKVLHCANAGVSTARNRGIDAASGEFLSFVDSDDYMSLDAYEKLLSADADLVYCDYAEVYEGNEIVHKSYPVGANRDETIHNMLSAGPRGGNIFNFALVRKSLLDKEGIRFPSHFKRGEDFWFAIHCFVTAKTIAHADAVYYYDCAVTSSATHNETVSTDASYLAFIDECIDYMRIKGCWDEYKKEIYWRILLEKTIWVTSPKYFKCYRDIHPEANAFVDSCPFLGRGIQLLLHAVGSDRSLCAKLLLLVNRIRNV